MIPDPEKVIEWLASTTPEVAHGKVRTVVTGTLMKIGGILNRGR